ncbi:HD domain-containing protein [Geminicoccus flavidas]|uniref:hypothetical protein n=1 Tax=Geminicoccus flavidas TaxID=2506407 RepID=UPI00190F0EEB|nr:hypothetical protein [Geminicoccus flavidas]
MMIPTDRFDDALSYASRLHRAQLRKGTRIPCVPHLLTVAANVADCTDSRVEPKPPWRARKAAYLEGLHHKPARSLLVSLANKTHNARAILGDRRQVGEAIWDRFTGGRDGTLWYYAGLAQAFRMLLPGPLADELDATVRAMAA